VVEILGFYHPALWWISHRIRAERENCCDDLAVQVCGDSLRYARALTCLEEMRHRHTELAVAASGGSLVHRIARLLDRPAPTRNRFTWLPGLIALLLVATILIPTALVLATPNVPPAASNSELSDPGQTTDDSAIEVTTETQADEDQQDQERIIVKFVIFAKVLPNQALDRETKLLIGDILTAEDPQALDDVAGLDAKENTTLGEILRTYVVGKHLSSETMEVLTDVLKSRGYLGPEARSGVQAHNNQQTEVNIAPKGPIPPAEDAIGLGIFLQVTPHFSPLTSDRITLEMALEFKERAKQDTPDNAPAIRTTEIASTVTVLRDRCFSLLIESDNAVDESAAGPELKLIMFRADCIKLPAKQENSPVPPTQQSDSHPRQVLLDVRTVVIEQNSLLNLGIEWGLPQRSNSSPSEWPDGVQIGYTPDATSTDSVQAGLSRLAEQGRAKLLSRRQVAALDGCQARVRAITEEWFSMHAQATADHREPQTEQVSIASGMVLSATPRIGDNNYITLELATEVSDSLPQDDENALPVVTRRKARNVVTVQDNGTVALAGLAEQIVDSEKQLLILVTASLVPENGQLPQTEPATLAPHPTGQVTLPERSGQTHFIHTDVNGQVDREFGYEELIHLDSGQWTVRKPYLSLPLGAMRCCVTADRGQAHFETTSGQCAPNDATFSGNVLVTMTPSDANGTHMFILDLDEATFSAQKNCLSGSGSVQFVCGGTQFVGRDLELFFGPTPNRPEGDRIKTADGIDLYITPSGVISVYLHKEETEQNLGDDEPKTKTVTATFVGTRLNDALTEIATQTGAKIAVDSKIARDSKLAPDHVTAELIGVTVETALETVLADTGYGFRNARDCFVVFPLITATFQGTDLREALVEIGQRAGVTLVSDPTVSGEVWAELRDVPLEKALETLLIGSPFKVQVTPNYYLVTGTEAQPPDPDTTPGHVDRLVTATFLGEDLREALQAIASLARVTIVCDPNVAGEVYAELEVPLETALEIVLAGTPFVATKTPDYYLVTTRAIPGKRQVAVTARFVLLDNAFMEALQRGLPIEGVTVPEDVNTLRAIGADLLANETPLLEPTQVRLLLKAVHRCANSKALAAPKVTVLDGESTFFDLAETLRYVSGYREPNDAPGEPVPLPQSKNIGVRLDVTPKLIENNNIRVGLDMKMDSLLEMHKALYQGKYEYDVPSFETVTIETESVIPDGHTALIVGGEIRSLDGTGLNTDQPARPWLILITPRKAESPPVPSTPSMPSEVDFDQGGMGGMGAFRPETPPLPKKQGAKRRTDRVS